MTKTISKLDQIFSVRSDKLPALRATIRDWKNLKHLAGANVTFSLVVDSNIILGDLIWLASKSKKEDARTQLMEAVDAKTIRIFAPAVLVREVEEKIPLIADKKNISVQALLFHWRSYIEKIEIVEPDGALLDALKNGVDPDDAPFVALAQSISASGVLSKDKHISMMGGNTISIDCIAHLRSYSRSTALELNIKVNGLLFVAHGTSAVRALLNGTKQIVDCIRNAPDWVKFSLVAGGLIVALHPKTRQHVYQAVELLLLGVADATPSVISFVTDAVILADRYKNDAKMHLDKARTELERSPISESMKLPRTPIIDC